MRDIFYITYQYFVQKENFQVHSQLNDYKMCLTALPCTPPACNNNKTIEVQNFTLTCANNAVSSNTVMQLFIKRQKMSNIFIFSLFNNSNL